MKTETETEVNKYLSAWITKAAFLERYDIFSKRHLTTLIDNRHTNGFNVCSKVIGGKALLHEGLASTWVLLTDDKKRAA